MACGLGAIILVFMIVKQNIDQPMGESDRLKSDLAQLQQQDAALQQSISKLNAAALSAMSKISNNQMMATALKHDAAKKSELLQRKHQEVTALKKTIKHAPQAKTNDVVKNNQGGEENYIMGIKVEGRKIVFLVDSSASMTDEQLIQIIRRKNSSDSNKKKGPKWQRTKRIMRWLLARTPKSSQLAVVTYNQTATLLGGSGWVSGGDASSINKLYRAMDKLVPSGATNLQQALQQAAALKPTDMYVLTDGLPTAGQSRYASLNPFASCSSLLGKSNNISGDCRVKLFRQSVNESAPKGGVKVNVILLPIEGDPQAAPEYWAWSASTGGLLISPALSWP